MTIKKRLTLSNLFMIVIPLMISIIIACGCIGIGYLILKSNKDLGFNEENFYETKQIISHHINESLNSSSPDKELNELTNLLDSNQIRILIYKGSNIYYEYGSYKDNDSELLDIVQNQEMFISKEGRQLYSYTHEVNDETFNIYIFCNYQTNSYRNLKELVIIFGFIMLLTIICSVLGTNYFLSKFVFKKIEKPLDLLLDGTRQLSNGNLDVQIQYDEDTEFKQIVDEFNTMSSELKNSIQKIKENEKNRQMLVAGISHDIKSPLTSILGYVEGIIDGVANTPEKQKKYLEVIKNKCLEIDKLVKQMITLTIVEQNNVKKGLNIIKSIQSFLDENQESYKNQGLQIESSFENDFIINLNIDDFYRVLSNIFDNSLKYKSKIEGKVCVTTKTLENENLLIFEDDGVGVGEDDLPHIFEPFFRVDKARNHPENGSGLGLAIVEKLIKDSNGKIFASNVEPNGLKIIMKWEKNANGKDINN